METETVPRLSPAVRAQLDAAAPPTIYGLPVRTLPGLFADQIMLMARRQERVEALAAAAGMELGPYEWKHEQTADGWKESCTAEWRPRVTMTE